MIGHRKPNPPGSEAQHHRHHCPPHHYHHSCCTSNHYSPRQKNRCSRLITRNTVNIPPFRTIVASKNLPTLPLDTRASCVSTPYTAAPPAPASAIASSCRFSLLVFFLPLHSRGSPHSCAYSFCPSLCALDDVATGYTRRTPYSIPDILLDELV